MSIRSMTGCGRATAQKEGLHAEVEVSSVNRKQLDIVLSLPRSLSILESRIHDEIARVLSRGRVSVNVVVRYSAREAGHEVVLNESLARAYLSTLRKQANKLQVRDDLGLSHLLSLPGVLHVRSPEENAERSWTVLQVALSKALERLDRMRQKEGAALARDLQARVKVLETLANEISELSPAAVVRFREALKGRLASMRDELGISDERLEREALLFADRSDITEETTRIASHLKQVREWLRGTQPAGKALDFLAQELNREINTIGSKANDAAIAQRVVQFKTELERLREQVQNIQ
ncbi:MAG: YicC family protein [Kiritimatiellae bacterium]|nr:YicC family protein [Kiritimatiellia bacterium]